MKVSKIDNRDYVLGRSHAEYQRLNTQGKIWENITSRILHDAGLQRGMKCLDVGCGTGSVMELMGKTVGKTGSVSGFDIDEKLGKSTVDALNKKGASDYFFLKGNIEEVEELPGTAFDFIYCRFLLIHLIDPQAAIQKMYKALKPGGVLLLQDYDFNTLHFSKDDLQIDHYFRDLVTKAFTKMNKDPRIGIRLGELLEKVSGRKADGQESSGIITSLTEALSMMKTAFENMLPALEKLELANRSDYDRFVDTSHRIAHDFPETSAFWPILGSAWIKKIIDPSYFKTHLIHKRFNEL